MPALKPSTSNPKLQFRTDIATLWQSLFGTVWKGHDPLKAAYEKPEYKQPHSVVKKLSW